MDIDRRILVYIYIYTYIYIYILEFSCRYPSTDDRLVAWIVQFKLAFCFLALFTMSAFGSKCQAKVGSGMAVSSPLDVKLALEWRFRGPLDVRWALERRFGEPLDVKLALEWRLGGKTPLMSPCRSEVLGGTFCIDIY